MRWGIFEGGTTAYWDIRGHTRWSIYSVTHKGAARSDTAFSPPLLWPLVVITSCIRHRQAKCIVMTAVCVCICLCVTVCVCLSLTAFPHYCMDPDVTLESGSRCPLVVHCWVDLQLVHGYSCYGSIHSY